MKADFSDFAADALNSLRRRFSGCASRLGQIWEEMRGNGGEELEKKFGLCSLRNYTEEEVQSRLVDVSKRI